LANALELTGNS